MQEDSEGKKEFKKGKDMRVGEPEVRRVGNGRNGLLEQVRNQSWEGAEERELS